MGTSGDVGAYLAHQLASWQRRQAAKRVGQSVNGRETLLDSRCQHSAGIVVATSVLGHIEKAALEPGPPRGSDRVNERQLEAATLCHHDTTAVARPPAAGDEYVRSAALEPTQPIQLRGCRSCKHGPGAAMQDRCQHLLKTCEGSALRHYDQRMPPLPAPAPQQPTKLSLGEEAAHLIDPGHLTLRCQQIVHRPNAGEQHAGQPVPAATRSASVHFPPVDSKAYRRTLTAMGLEAHGGRIAVEVARAYGVDMMWTLSGAHVFPMYDGATKIDPPMRLVDVRHEQTAVFAAEATAKLTRRPGLAVLTAGPGVTNGISAVTTAHFNGSPLLVVGGRAPNYRWGAGSLQELDHPALLAPVTKYAGTVAKVGDIAGAVGDALAHATSPHRGPVFLDIPMDEFFSVTTTDLPTPATHVGAEPDPDAVAAVVSLLASSERPVLVLGSDVWSGGADAAARRTAETLRLPVITNGMGRGILPPKHELLVTKTRSVAFREADLVIVAGTPLDFRLGFGVFGDAQVVHLADAPESLAGHVTLAGAVSGDLAKVFDALAAASPAKSEEWLGTLRDASAATAARDAVLLDADASPIHPARVYGELRRLLADDAVVIGDGGDFVSFAGKYLEPAQPGGWLDPGPYGCLGTGLGYAMAARIARPASQVVLLLGDGAAGFSLMDVDTLVRHRLPVVMICGNNGVWGLEKAPMQMLYGYDVAADLQPQCRYHDVVRALGGAGEMVTDPGGIGPALRRAFDAEVPYLVNVITDPAAGYPRSTMGI